MPLVLMLTLQISQAQVLFIVPVVGVHLLLNLIRICQYRGLKKVSHLPKIVMPWQYRCLTTMKYSLSEIITAR